MKGIFPALGKWSTARRLHVSLPCKGSASLMVNPLGVDVAC